MRLSVTEHPALQARRNTTWSIEVIPIAEPTTDLYYYRGDTRYAGLLVARSRQNQAVVVLQLQGGAYVSLHESWLRREDEPLCPADSGPKTAWKNARNIGRALNQAHKKDGTDR